MNTKRFFLLAMLMCFISVCAHAQLILLEEDESGVVETVQQAVTPQVQSVATPAPQPAPQQQQIVAEEEEENLFAPKQQAQPAKSSKAKAEPKPKAEKAPKQKAEKAPKAEPAQQPKKQQGLVMEEEEDDAAAKAKAEAERKAAEEAARVEAERKAAEAAAAAEAARLEAERKAAEEAAAAEAARQEAERLAAEEAAKAEAERLAAEEAAKAAVVVPVVAPVLVEEEQAAPQSSEALKAAEMQAKLDSVLRVQREQEEQLRRLQEQKQAVQTERDREDAALMERARQEAEARAKAKAEAERRAQLEEERRFNEAQVQANEEPKDKKKKKETVFTRYYKHNGQNMLSFLSFGYSTLFVLDGNLASNSADMVFKRHMLSFEAFEWRAKCFGMQLFNFEMGLNTDQYFNGPLYGGANADPKTQTIVNDIQPADAKTMWFAYKPAIKFYIPCTKWMAVELYGGMEVDLCAVWSKINQSYYPVNSLIPAQNFFFSGFGGLGLMFTPTPYVPMELKAEYRHPVKGNTAIVPQGVYLSLQIHIATPTKKR